SASIEEFELECIGTALKQRDPFTVAYRMRAEYQRESRTTGPSATGPDADQLARNLFNNWRRISRWLIGIAVQRGRGKFRGIETKAKRAPATLSLKQFVSRPDFCLPSTRVRPRHAGSLRARHVR